jgi:hypothetical protein
VHTKVDLGESRVGLPQGLPQARRFALALNDRQRPRFGMRYRDMDIALADFHCRFPLQISNLFSSSGAPIRPRPEGRPGPGLRVGRIRRSESTQSGPVTGASARSPTAPGRAGPGGRGVSDTAAGLASDSERLGSTRIDSERLGAARSGSERLGATRIDSERAAFRPAPRRGPSAPRGAGGPARPGPGSERPGPARAGPSPVQIGPGPVQSTPARST